MAGPVVLGLSALSRLKGLRRQLLKCVEVAVGQVVVGVGLARTLYDAKNTQFRVRYVKNWTDSKAATSTEGLH